MGVWSLIRPTRTVRVLFRRGQHGLFRSHGRGRFVVHLAETTAKFLGGAPEFPQGFVERFLELLFEVPCHRPEIRIHARNSSDDSRETFRSEHHQTRHQ